MQQKIINAAKLDIYLKGTQFCGVIQGTHRLAGNESVFTSLSPIDNTPVANFGKADSTEVEQVIERSKAAFLQFRTVPAPIRGELVRRIGNLARERKTLLAELISLEAGKIKEEAQGEVQELIDICDFAVGQSRQLYGLTIASERPEHRMMEQWHPLGPVAIITAFNFPVAVWGWNAALALICGNSLIWKPSEQTSLCALACQQLVEDASSTMAEIPDDLTAVLLGDKTVADPLISHRDIALVSATGSTEMGRTVSARVAQRLGRVLLELGGNNGMIVTPSANLDLALRAIVFAAVGTCGQRCTSLRRVIAHESIIDELETRLIKAYTSLPVGNPFSDKTLIGPLVNRAAVKRFQAAIETFQKEGNEIIYGGQLREDLGPGNYVTPAIGRQTGDSQIIGTETFGPLLYLTPYETLPEAISIHNSVTQGLSSAIFTSDLQEAEQFLGPAGSDCGISNVNIGTSGAEIGGAFGGEKDTGGGRESGSDAWKNYMRRATNTINYGTALPLAQGIQFDI
ncbi:aldehyde dehydrogenase family protein [Oleiphilus messinensis]|uniref:Aldehyde dehydrogenase family protein n=1 Tax=Oleiphilus messinensis TaxID=141451 RepID=A0A1Y0IAP6_9GAMM|nr:aldehyde dehydrogenase family protein [Oleiphilus messinensis]ARU57597.1 aldehyde dehydrogenase family protein [Oleiphilus messinensis]